MDKAAPISSDLFHFLNSVHDQSAEMLRDVTFDKQLERDGLLVGTYASLIELTGGLAVLVHYDRYSAVSAVFRTLLEAYVDFKNLFDDPSYVKHLYAKPNTRLVWIPPPRSCWTLPRKFINVLGLIPSPCDHDP